MAVNEMLVASEYCDCHRLAQHQTGKARARGEAPIQEREPGLPPQKAAKKKGNQIINVQLGASAEDPRSVKVEKKSPRARKVAPLSVSFAFDFEQPADSSFDTDRYCQRSELGRYNYVGQNCNVPKFMRRPGSALDSRF